MNTFKKINWEIVLISLVYIFIIYLLVIYSYYKSFNFDGIAIDGTFQHLNPLRRIENGEIAGLEFPVFHGMFFMYIAYPLYKLMGGNLFSAEFSKYFLNGILFIVANFFIYRFFFSSIFAHKLTILTSLFLFIAKLLFINEIFYSMWIFWLMDSFSDAYSTSNIRILIPVIGLYLVYSIFLNFTINNKLKYLLIAFIGFIAYLFSTEQGLAAILSIFISIIIFLSIERKYKEVFLFSSIYLIFLVTLFMIIKNLNVDFGINYLNSLVKDQYWFFGAPPANLINLDFSDYENVIFYKFIISLLLSIFAFSILYKKYFFQFSLLFFYAVVTNVSMLGMASTHYIENFLRVSILIFFIALIKYFNSNIYSKKYSIIILIMLLSFPYWKEIDNINKVKNLNFANNIYIEGVRLSERWNYSLLKESIYVDFNININNSSLKEMTYLYFKDDRYLEILKIGDILKSEKDEYMVTSINKTENFITINKAININSLQDIIFLLNRTTQEEKIFTDSTYDIKNSLYNGTQDFLYENKNCFYTNQVVADIRVGDRIQTKTQNIFKIDSIDRNYICINGKLNHYLDGYPNKMILEKQQKLQIDKNDIVQSEYFTAIELPKKSFIRLVDVSDKITINGQQYPIDFIQDNKIFINRFSSKEKVKSIIFNNVGNAGIFTKNVKIENKLSSGETQFLTINKNYTNNININDKIENTNVVGKYKNIILLDKVLPIEKNIIKVEESKNKVKSEYTINDRSIFTYMDNYLAIKIGKFNISEDNPTILLADYIEFNIGKPIKIEDGVAYYYNIPLIIERINFTKSVKIIVHKEEKNLLDIDNIIEVKSHNDKNWKNGIREDSKNTYYYVDMNKTIKDELNNNKKIFDLITNRYYDIELLDGDQISISKKDSRIKEKIFTFNKYELTDSVKPDNNYNFKIFNDLKLTMTELFRAQINDKIKKYTIKNVTDTNWKSGVSTDRYKITVDSDTAFLSVQSGDLLTINNSNKFYRVENVYKNIIRLDTQVDKNILQKKNQIKIYSSKIPLVSENLGNNLVEDYTGLLSLVMKQNNPTKIDYIIHALGDYRSKYNTLLENENIDFINILANKYIPHALWLRYTFWGYYKSILNNYVQLTSTHHSHLLKRFDDIALLEVDENNNLGYRIIENNNYLTYEANWSSIKIKNNNNILDLSSFSFKSNKLYEIKFKYNINNLISKLPMVGKSPRVFLYPLNEVWNDLPYTLDVNRKEMIVPYFSKSDEPLRFMIKKYPYLGGLFDIDFENIQIREIEVNNYDLIDQIFIK